MTMFFAKKLNKKGFTLAELLIVVAIIAVLVAVAVPIFVGELTKAKKAVLSSGARAVKPIAVNRILAEEELHPTNAIGWVAVAKITGDGDIEELRVGYCAATVTGDVKYSLTDAFTSISDKGGITSGDVLGSLGSDLDTFVGSYKNGNDYFVAVPLNNIAD